jgi:glyoxylase-like metal-dependent hydrolase (beta-lactamase superfamily II)
MSAQNNKHYFYTPSQFLLDGGAMFGIIPKPLWNKKIVADDRNRILMTARIWIIRTKNKLVVVDSGIGDYHDPVFQERFGISYLENTESAFQKLLGCSTNDVTDVVMTHLHFDHAGGLLSKGSAEKNEMTYPNAKLHLSAGHLEYSKRPTLRDTGSFHKKYINQAIEYYQSQNLLHLYSEQEGELRIEEAGLKFLCAHGHTPWQLLPYDNHYFFLGDTVPTHAHIDLPWVMGYDMAPGVSAEERSNIYNLIIEKNLTVIFNHDVRYQGAKLIKTEKGYEWIDLK